MKRETKLQKWGLRKCKKELDKVFSIFIRTRDNFTCFTCGRKGDRGGIDNGHYIPRGACGLELYFSEENCHAQCADCNHRLEGNRHVYKERLGDIHDKLYNIYYTRNSAMKWSQQDYLDKIEHYEALLRQM